MLEHGVELELVAGARFVGAVRVQETASKVKSSYLSSFSPGAVGGVEGEDEFAALAGVVEEGRGGPCGGRAAGRFRPGVARRMMAGRLGRVTSFWGDDDGFDGVQARLVEGGGWRRR